MDPEPAPPPQQATSNDELNPALVRVAASLSIAAGVIHLVMVPPHAGESMSEGLGFALAGWFQIITAWLLLTRKQRSFLMPIAVANAAFIGAWVWSRTAGLPFGAHKGIKEPMGFVDLTCVGLEVALLVTCAAPRTTTERHARHRRSKHGMRLALGVIIGVFALTTAAVASPGARDHGAHTHDDGTAPLPGTTMAPPQRPTTRACPHSATVTTM